ncbi:putative effector of murein hydrolase LrgA [Solemya velum gill symbiont]|nr:putative effector of murein hydrolase LrgA [Solemya velum gill symbiont]
MELPVPGPVIGMLLLFLTLLARDALAETMEVTVEGLLKNLSLLFVPAGVGVITHFELLGENWPAISIALVISSILGMVVTALTMKFLMRSNRG